MEKRGMPAHVSFLFFYSLIPSLPPYSLCLLYREHLVACMKSPIFIKKIPHCHSLSLSLLRAALANRIAHRAPTQTQGRVEQTHDSKRQHQTGRPLPTLAAILTLDRRAGAKCGGLADGVAVLHHAYEG